MTVSQRPWWRRAGCAVAGLLLVAVAYMWPELGQALSAAAGVLALGMAQRNRFKSNGSPMGRRRARHWRKLSR